MTATETRTPPLVPEASRIPGSPRVVDRRIVIAGLLVVLLLSALDGTIVSTAMPTIVGHFGGFERFTWVTTAYVVTSTIASLLLGKLSDLYGRRRLLLIATAIFVGGSALCGAAQSLTALIIFRAIQGIGGGIWSLTFATVGDIVPPRERGKYFGLFTGVFALASVAGPLLGGFIVDNTSWRWIFYVNVPLGLGAAILLMRTLHLPKPTRKARLDLVGSALLIVSVGIFMVALEQGSDRGWTDRWILGLFLAAVVTGVGFVVRQTRVPEPILPLRVLRDPVVAAALLLGFFVGATMMSSGLFFALYFQDVAFYSPTISGLATLPIMLGVLCNSTLTGRLISRWGKYRIFPRIGTPLGILGFGLASFVDSGTSYVFMGFAMLCIGFSAGLSMPTTSIAAQNAAPPSDMGIVTAALSFFRSLGSAITLAISGIVLNTSLTGELSRRLPNRDTAKLVGLVRAPRQIKALDPATRLAVTHSISLAISHVFWLMVGLSILSLIAALLLRDRPLRDTVGLVPAAE